MLSHCLSPDSRVAVARQYSVFYMATARVLQWIFAERSLYTDHYVKETLKRQLIASSLQPHSCQPKETIGTNIQTQSAILSSQCRTSMAGIARKATSRASATVGMESLI